MKTKKNIILLGFLAAILFLLSDTIVTYLQSDDSVLFALTYTRLIGIVSIGVLTLAYLVLNNVKPKPETETREWTTSYPVSDKMDPIFLSAILHQFKLPLNVIVGFADLIKNTDLNTKTRNIYSNYIYHNSIPLLQLLDNVIDLFSIETNQITIKKEECNVNKVFEELFFEFNGGILKDQQDEGLSGSLVKSGHTGEIIVRSDFKRLKQVLSNLVTNSFQFSDLSRIEMGYQIKEEFLEFYIKDNIQVLSLDNLNTIFTDFKKNTAIQNQSLMVAALRLTIAQKLIRRLGGEIWSERINGTQKHTYFKLPLDIIEKPVTAKGKEKHKDIPSWDNFKLLIVEDIEANYIYLEELLKPTNIKITWAQNGRKAVDIVKKSPEIDVILMDILMPEMDGYEAARLIKADNPGIPIIVQTAYSLENEPEETLVNFEDILTKPLWSNELFRVLSKFLIPGTNA